MLSRKSYNLVIEEPSESKPSSDASLYDGISFKAKLIGSMEVPHPHSRMEIVSAMRAVRYDFKERGVKKTKVQLCVSMSLVSVQKQPVKAWLKHLWTSAEDDEKFLFQHPINRIFYVSHDSQDPKLFSYIACDTSGIFRCHVFKADRKSVAVNVVRSVGLAFDACHKVTQQQQQSEDVVTDINDDSASDDKTSKQTPAPEFGQSDNDVAEPSVIAACQQPLVSDASNSLMHLPLQKSSSASPHLETGVTVPANTPVGVYRHHLRTIREKLRVELIRSQQLASELELARKQLQAETEARISMQTRAQRLLDQNQQILKHASELLSLISDEMRNRHSTSTNAASTLESSVTLLANYFAGMTLHSTRDSDLVSLSAQLSPDSGNRDMSTYSLSTSAIAHSDLSWYSALTATGTSAHHSSPNESIHVETT